MIAKSCERERARSKSCKKKFFFSVKTAQELCFLVFFLLLFFISFLFDDGILQIDTSLLPLSYRAFIIIFRWEKQKRRTFFCTFDCGFNSFLFNLSWLFFCDLISYPRKRDGKLPLLDHQFRLEFNFNGC